MRVGTLLVAITATASVVAMPAGAGARKPSKHQAKRHHRAKPHKHAKHHTKAPVPSRKPHVPSPTPPAPTPANTSPPAPVSFNASNVPVGYYQCYHSFPSYNAVTNAVTGYNTIFADSFTLAPDSTYDVTLRGFTGHWSSANNSIAFVGGGFNEPTSHELDQGTYVPGGATMPHNQINDGSVYTIVLQGNGFSDARPPTMESDTAITGSFWYCKLR